MPVQQSRTLFPRAILGTQSPNAIGQRWRPDPATLLHRGVPMVVVLLLLIGAWARIHQYAANASYWYDEAYLLLNIFDKSCLELLGPLRDDQAGPPLFFWCLRGMFRIGGPSEWVMRAPAFVASWLGLALAAVVARRMLTNASWLWVVGFCATCKHAIERGAEVKPYAGDFAVTLIVLLAVVIFESARERRRLAGAGLWILALLAPWSSLPSVFVLGGASLALLYIAARSKTRLDWTVWIGFNLCAALSAGALQLLVLRHQRTPQLVGYWEQTYGDPSLAGRVAAIANCLIGIGQYGSNGLGIPLVVLALLGACLLWRRSPNHLLLLAGPLALSIGASLLHLYPMDDRLVFFVIPCLFLLAGEGIGALIAASCHDRCPRWLGCLSIAGLTILLLPGLGPTGKIALKGPEPGFREAFAYVHQHAADGDVYWVSHPQVFEVYFRDCERCLGSYDAPADVVNRVRGHRIWCMTAGVMPPELERGLHEAGFRVVDTYRIQYVTTILLAQTGKS